MNKKVLDSFNEQVNKEFFSAYMYLSMAAYFESINLKGFANWMHVQAKEEVTHAMKFFNYIIQRGGNVKLEAINKPQIEWASPVSVFNDALKHEKFVTNSINNLVTIAGDEKDYASLNFLQWFVSEQVEEEDNANTIIQQLKLAGEGSGLFLLDQELGKRVFVDETQSS